MRKASKSTRAVITFQPEASSPPQVAELSGSEVAELLARLDRLNMLCERIGVTVRRLRDDLNGLRPYYDRERQDEDTEAVERRLATLYPRHQRLAGESAGVQGTLARSTGRAALLAYHDARREAKRAAAGR